MLHAILLTDVYFPFVCGVTKVIKIFTEELPRYGIKTTIVAPKSIKEAYVFRKDGRVNTFFVKSLRLLSIYPDVKTPEPLSTFFVASLLLKNFGFSNGEYIIHAHSPYMVTSMLRLRAKICRRKLPLLLTYHTITEEYIKNRFGWLKVFLSRLDGVFMGDLMDKLKAIIIPTNYAGKKLISHIPRHFGILRKKLIRIPNPLSRKDYETPSKSAHDYFDFIEDLEYAIWVGRISHEKNLGYLIRIFRRIPYKLVIVGGGPLEERLRSIAPKNVVFTGFVDATMLRSLLKSARCFVVANSFDNMPLAVMEAMAQGVPVISYHEGGHNEYIIHKKNGFIFRNIYEAREYITKIFKSDDLREEMGGCLLYTSPSPRDRG